MKRKSIICGIVLFLVFCGSISLLYYNLSKTKDSKVDVLSAT